jgi:hypothetical protein
MEAPIRHECYWMSDFMRIEWKTINLCYAASDQSCAVRLRALGKSDAQFVSFNAKL